MNQEPRPKHYLELHFIVLLFGFTAILNKLISISSTELTVYRMSLAALTMGILFSFQKKSFKIQLSHLLPILLVGLIVAAHWVFFFEAINVSNVSVTLGVMASGTLFVSLLEPLVERRKIWWVEVAIGLLIILGLYIIAQFAFNYITGILYALLSSFLAALFGVFNRQLTKKHDPVIISFYEMVAGAIGVFLYLQVTGQSLVSPLPLAPLDYLWIPILAVLCTAYAFVGVVRLMRHLTAYTVSLAVNLEPIYGMLFAVLIFGESEEMDLGFYVGAVIIILSVFIYPILEKRKKAEK